MCNLFYRGLYQSIYCIIGIVSFIYQISNDYCVRSIIKCSLQVKSSWWMHVEFCSKIAIYSFQRREEKITFVVYFLRTKHSDLQNKSRHHNCELTTYVLHKIQFAASLNLKKLSVKYTGNTTKFTNEVSWKFKIPFVNINGLCKFIWKYP